MADSILDELLAELRQCSTFLEGLGDHWQAAGNLPRAEDARARAYRAEVVCARATLRGLGRAVQMPQGGDWLAFAGKSRGRPFSPVLDDAGRPAVYGTELDALHAVRDFLTCR